MGQAPFIYDTTPTAADDAESRLDHEDSVQAHIASTARALLLDRRINANLVGHALPDLQKLASNASLDKILEHLAPNGLHFFALDVGATATFKVSAEDSATFLFALLRRAALERVRRDLHGDKPYALQRATRSLEPDNDLDDPMGDHGFHATDPLHGVLQVWDPEESAAEDLGEAVRLLGDIKRLLGLRHREDEKWQLSVNQWFRRGATLIDDAFRVPENDSDAFTAEVANAVDAAFDTHANGVTVRGRKSYTGIIATSLGLTGGSLAPQQSYDRAHKAIGRAQAALSTLSTPPSAATAVKVTSEQAEQASDGVRELGADARPS